MLEKLAQIVSFRMLLSVFEHGFVENWGKDWDASFVVIFLERVECLLKDVKVHFDGVIGQQTIDTA